MEATGELRVHRAHHVGEVTWAQYYPAGVAPDHRYYDYKVGKTTATGAVSARMAASSRVTLSAGVQVSRHSYEMSNDRIRGVAFTKSYGFVLPRAGAVVKLGPSGDAYVNVARGMREPFFRNIYDPQDYYATAPVSLDPEDVWNVEAGTSWRRDRWRLRANAFWMNFRNEIVYAGALDDNGVPIYGNGARSRRRGLELDGGVALPWRAGVDATLSLSRNTFVRYREHDWEGGTAVYDGNRVAGFPDVMASVSAHADLGRSRITVALRHAGRFYLDNTESASRVNPAYTTADAAAKVPLPARAMGKLGLGRCTLELRVNNLLDARYTSFGYVDGGVPLYIPAAGRNVYGGVTIGF
jgi:iron complex outermembrane receptor protein